VEITNARLSERREAYADYLYARLQRRGFCTATACGW
jgi:phosphotransacetylase